MSLGTFPGWLFFLFQSKFSLNIQVCFPTRTVNRGKPGFDIQNRCFIIGVNAAYMEDVTFDLFKLYYAQSDRVGTVWRPCGEQSEGL